MPANLLSSSSLLSGAVFSLLLLWLLCSALMTLRVRPKQRQVDATPAPVQKEQASPSASVTQPDEPERADVADTSPDAGGLVETAGARLL